MGCMTGNCGGSAVQPNIAQPKPEQPKGSPTLKFGKPKIVRGR